MKFESTETWGFEHAIRCLYNSVSSESKSDSGWKGFCTESDDWVDESCSYDACLSCCERVREFFIGPNDLALMQRLIKLGDNHREFLGQIFVSVDITAPLFWWREFGIIIPMSEILHKFDSAPITKDCFEMGDFVDINIFPLETTKDVWDIILDFCEKLRLKYIETKDKVYLKELVRILPESWVQTRTVTMSYEKLLFLINQQVEGSVDFVNWVKTLPYAKELLLVEGDLTEEK